MVSIYFFILVPFRQSSCIRQDVASVIGVDNYIKLCEEFGGSSLFFPKIDHIIRNRVYKKVIELKDVVPVYQIARMLGISRATAYKVIKEYKDKHSCRYSFL